MTRSFPFLLVLLLAACGPAGGAPPGDPPDAGAVSDAACPEVLDAGTAVVDAGEPVCEDCPECPAEPRRVVRVRNTSLENTLLVRYGVNAVGQRVTLELGPGASGELTDFKFDGDSFELRNEWSGANEWAVVEVGAE